MASALRVGAPVRRSAGRSAPQMSIAVFGASGGTGSEAVLQALERGESVTALVRLQDTLSAFALGLGAALVVVGQMVLIGVLERRAWATAGELLLLAAVVADGTWLF